MDPELAAFFAPPSDADRDRIRADLIHRARLVSDRGWGDYLYVWSSGEVAGVAYLLQDDDALRELEETEELVLGRYAYDLYGISGGNGERLNGWAGTRAWFDEARSTISE